MKLYVVALHYQVRLHEDYGNLRMRLQVAHARRLFGEVCALKSDETAEQIKERFRVALKPYDSLLVIHATEWASRRAAFDLGKF